ncbi:MAG: nucleotidyltransferase domain-containing protein [Magnetococcales bacterium]|nr:nucleotidyltransferase domain-containing protein [Magnetococcales bacterium]
MGEVPLIDIRPDHWEIVRAILKKHVSDREVWAFGSRAKWTAKQYSDLDLCILGDGPLELEQQASLEEDFSESDLPFKVDVVDWATTADGFRGIIGRERVMVQEMGDWGVVDNWREQPLSSLCTYLNRGTTPAYIDIGGILVLNQKCVRDQRVNFALARRTDPQQKPVAAERIIQPLDILVNSTGIGTLGRVAQIRRLPETATVDSHVTLIRPNREVIDPLYLGLALRCFEPEIEALGEGSTGQTELSRSRLGTFLVSMPSNLDEQRAIAQVLGALDDKIELNRRMNADLEAMARAVFKDWFVDFGPVRAKTEGRPAYLAKEIWDLFPDALDDEDKPVGWISSPLAGIADLNPREKLIKGDPVPYLEMSALPTGGGWPEPPVLRPFEAGSKFRNGDTLLARITPCLENGKTAFVHCLEDGQVGWGSTEFIVIRPIKPFPEEFGYLLARDPRFRDFAIQSMTGTSGRQRVQVDSLAGYEITAPRTDLLSIFGSFIKPCFKQIKANAKESQTLAHLRDLLLPKLITGEIRVRDAEKAVEAVL